MNRYFVYCRKSTDDDDHQVLSIESQISELKKLTEREKLQVVEQFEEARSAKVPGRPIFNAMLKRIERGEAEGIIAWHPDRLARNPVDGGWIIHLLDSGKIIDLKFPTYGFENSSQGKFTLGMMFVQSKYYVDSLSENVRRGNRTKREHGWLPNLAPVGYLNVRSDAGEKIIIADPERFPLVERLWRMFLPGAYSVDDIQRIASSDLGLRTKKRKRIGGNSITVSGIYRLLSCPFYTGNIVFEGRWYPGKHPAMITVTEFERAQVLLGKGTRPRPQTHRFAHTGLITCGTCGCSITAEVQVNRQGHRYTYYRCTRKRRDMDCREPFLEEKQLEVQLSLFLERIYLDDETLKDVLKLLDAERQKESNIAEKARAAVEKALVACKENLQKLTRLCYRGLISETEFEAERAALLLEEKTMAERLQHMTSESWLEPARNLFLFSNRAIFWLLHGSIDEKRLILATIGSNPTLKAKLLSIDAKKPFRILEERNKNSNLCTTLNEVRTFFETNPDFVIPLLPEVRPT